MMTQNRFMRDQASRKLLLAVAIFIAMPCTCASVYAAQSASATQADSTSLKLPVYDVVSIKPAKSGSVGSGFRWDKDTFAATNVSLKSLVSMAYDIKPELISGVSGAVASAQFDVIAKMLDPNPDVLKKLSNKQRQSMLLPLLEERFQLKAHPQTKILPIYEMVVTKDGPKFKPSPDAAKRGSGWGFSSGKFNAHDLSMTDLASELTDLVHRTVTDKTGLTGSYSFDLKWTPDDAPAPSASANPSADTDPSIFTALQEQLGLKLKPAKGPVETLVVDHVAMPSEN
jgi:uncharacterized protein (TIGR03435 family)